MSLATKLDLIILLINCTFLPTLLCIETKNVCPILKCVIFVKHYLCDEIKVWIDAKNNVRQKWLTNHSFKHDKIIRIGAATTFPKVIKFKWWSAMELCSNQLSKMTTLDTNRNNTEYEH